MTRAALKETKFRCPKCKAGFANQSGMANHVRYAGCGVTDSDLFWGKVNKGTHQTGCWLWTGFLNHDGYGRVGPKP